MDSPCNTFIMGCMYVGCSACPDCNYNIVINRLCVRALFGSGEMMTCLMHPTI